MVKIVITFRDTAKEQLPSFSQRDYRPLINQAFESAKKHNYNTVLVSDGTEPSLMNWILEAQHSFIEGSSFDDNSVLFSPDAIIAKPLEPIFDMDFDIAVTVREHYAYPINNGVIYLKPEKKELIAKLWQEIRNRCKRYSIEKQKWYGDQLALHEVLLEHNDKPYGLKVLRLPCSLYNHSPDTELDALMSEAYVLHFKGDRKEVMVNHDPLSFWENRTKDML